MGGRCRIAQCAVRSALYALGFGKEASWHGFRASARTILVDELDLNPEAIEANLVHAVKDANGRSYNRTMHLEKRCEQTQQWAENMAVIEKGADVLPYRASPRAGYQKSGGCERHWAVCPVRRC